MAFSDDFPGFITIGGIQCIELDDGSGRGQARAGDGRAQRRFLIAWANLPNFLKALVGYKTYAGGTTTVYPPLAHPMFANWYANDTDFEPVGQPSGENTWEYAKVTAYYGPLSSPDTGGGDPVDGVEEEIDFDVDVLTVPTGALKDSSNNVISQPQKLLMGCASYVLRMRDQPTPPGGTDFSTIFGLLGKVNTGTFRGAAAKKMLFVGGRCRRRASTFDDLDSESWESELRFKYRTVEWTKVFSPALGTFAEATTVTGGNPLYDDENLNPLLPS